MAEPLIFDLSKDGRRGYTLPELDVPRVDPGDHLPAKNLRKELNLP